MISIDYMSPELVLIIAGNLKPWDLLTFIRVSKGYQQLLEPELQSRAVAGGEGPVGACNQRKIQAVL